MLVIAGGILAAWLIFFLIKCLLCFIIGLNDDGVEWKHYCDERQKWINEKKIKRS